MSVCVYCLYELSFTHWCGVHGMMPWKWKMTRGKNIPSKISWNYKSLVVKKGCGSFQCPERKFGFFLLLCTLACSDQAPSLHAALKLAFWKSCFSFLLLVSKQIKISSKLTIVFVFLVCLLLTKYVLIWRTEKY